MRNKEPGTRFRSLLPGSSVWLHGAGVTAVGIVTAVEDTAAAEDTAGQIGAGTALSQTAPSAGAGSVRGKSAIQQRRT